jgi:Fe-S cluster assembly protein SufB
VIFSSISEAMNEYPDLIEKYLGSVIGDNYFASKFGRFTDGSFVYIPENTICP